MREEPPQSLIALVETLGLATAGQVRGLDRRVRRMACGLPCFESVWIDAMAQTGLLTPLQATEIKSGRGQLLRIGPYLLRRPLPAPGYAGCYLAREAATKREVRLSIFTPKNQTAAELLAQLQELIVAGKRLKSEFLAPLRAAGEDGGRVWAACEVVPGVPASQWTAHNGRMPPETVLAIARQMASGMAAIERNGMAHGDISLASLVLGTDGRSVLIHAGLRGLLHREEGYAQADLPPEAYDYLAPERITEGSPPSAASDMFACGLVWWHLLTGRPPLAGGDSLSKLRSAVLSTVRDVRQLAPETPKCLAEAIAACTERAPGLRPESMTRLLAMLGSPTREGQAALARCVRSFARPSATTRAPLKRVQAWTRSPRQIAAAVACLLVMSLAAWAFRDSQSTAPQARLADSRDPAVRAASSDRTPASPRPSKAGSRDPGGESPKMGESAERNELVLAGETATAAETLRLRADAVIRGPSQRRAAVLIPAGGFALREPNMRFENIDFVYRGIARPAVNGEAAETPAASAMIRLAAPSVEFCGCTFQANAAEGRGPAAIDWTYGADSNAASTTLANGKLTLRDCVFRGVSAGIESRVAGAIAVTAANVLYAAQGPLLRLARCPRGDEPVRIALATATIREGGCLLECYSEPAEEEPGSIVIEADNSVFASTGGRAVIEFVGGQSPQRLVSRLRWNGQGSLVASGTPVAQWRATGGKITPLDEAAISIAGLARSEIRFAGPIEQGPAANRVVRWEGPSLSPNPPGIDPQSLGWPR
jgi:eukaryotic-like serine/threonine-protein kinase